MATYQQTFQVEGSGNFPYDMLRYDQCWPALEGDSNELDNNPMTRGDDYFSKLRRITLRRRVQNKSDAPTLPRWRSFSWRVVEETIETYKAP